MLITFVDRKNKCDLCNEYLDVIKQYKETLENKNSLVFAVIDGANNEARGIPFEEKDLPFIYLYTNGEKHKTKYKYNPEKKEEISVEKLDLFIKETLKTNDAKEDL